MTDVSTQSLPDDEWHNYVYLFLVIQCQRCHATPDLEWAWAGLSDDESGAQSYAVRVVPHLTQQGWQMLDGSPHCPTCSAS